MIIERVKKYTLDDCTRVYTGWFIKHARPMLISDPVELKNLNIFSSKIFKHLMNKHFYAKKKQIAHNFFSAGFLSF